MCEVRLVYGNFKRHIKYNSSGKWYSKESLGSTDVTQPKRGGWRGTDLLVVSMNLLSSVEHLLGEDAVISL